MSDFFKRIPLSLKVSIIYLVSALFIASITNYAIITNIKNQVVVNYLQAYSEVFFILATAIIIYFVFRLNLYRIEKSKKALESSEKKYREIVENANSAIIKFDLTGKILFFNEYAEKLYGYNSNEIMGKNIYEFIQPYKDHFKKLNNEIFVKKITQSILSEPYVENWTYSKDKKRIYLGWTNKPIYNKRNELIGINAIGIDLTEKKIMNDRIVESERKLKQIFNLVSDGIIIIDFNGKIIEQNTPILKALGLTKADMESNDTNRNIMLRIMPGIENKIEEIIKSGEIIFDVDIETPIGGKMALEIRATKIKYQGKDAIIAVGRNIISKKLNQQKIYNAALDAEEKERQRVAKELHDSISPLLSTVKLYIQTIKECDSEDMRSKIVSKTENTINDCIKSISEISNNLSPHVLENFGLIDAIQVYAENISEVNQLKIHINSNQFKLINKTIELTVYRVITELINNTMKYAKATTVNVSLNLVDSVFEVVYFDDGIGFNKDEIINTSKGMGLYNITNRIKSINGKVEFITKENEGVKVKINLPIE